MSLPSWIHRERWAESWGWYATAVVVSGYGVAALAIREPWAAAPIAMAMLGILFAATAVYPVQTLAVLVTLFGAAGLPLGAEGFDVGIRIYPLDLILAAQLIGMAAGSFVDSSQWNHRWPLRSAFLLLLAYLTASLGHGLASGNTLRDALGDYRRMALYPLALFVFAGSVRERRGIEAVLKAVAWASYATAAIATVRVLTGIGYAEEHLAGTTIRYLSYVEASTAGLGVLVLLGYARIAIGRARLRYALAALVPFAALLVSNYRTAWLALGIGLFVQFVSLGWRRGLGIALLGSVILVPAAYILIVHTQLGASILDRFNALNATTSGLWRYFSWLTAIKTWLAHPWLGTGLGYAHQFEFFDIYSGNYAASTTSSIHNDPLWFLVNNGLVGVAIALVFLVPWLRRALRLIRGESPFARLVGSSALGGLALMVTVSCLQPFFSTAATIEIAMALIALVIRVNPDELPLARVAAGPERSDA